MSKRLIRQLDDGTLQSNVAVYAQSWARRYAIVSTIIDNKLTDHGTCFVEIELRSGRVFHCELITAATSNNGGAEIVVVREADRLVPSAYSLATVRSISQLTTAEWARRVMS